MYVYILNVTLTALILHQPVQRDNRGKHHRRPVFELWIYNCLQHNMYTRSYVNSNEVLKCFTTRTDKRIICILTVK